MPKPKGKLVTPVGITAAGNIIALLIDDEGHLQVDLLSLPADIDIRDINEAQDHILIYGIDSVATNHTILTDTQGRPLVRNAHDYTLTNREAYDAAVGNHAWTERWRYTVGANKRALVTGILLNLQTTSAAGDTEISVEAALNGGTAPVKVVGLASLATQWNMAHIPAGLELQEADYIKANTKNSSASNYVITVTLTYIEGAAP